MCFHLNHPAGNNRESRSENARGRLFLIEDLAKQGIRSPKVGRCEISMVKEIEKLEADGEDAIFPMWNLRIFHNRKVCADVARATKTVAALSKRNARAAAGTVQWDAKFKLVKINPLLSWTRKDVWDFILKHDIPYNPFHDRGYPSIGCAPCTRAVQPGEDKRAGRWWWESTSKECGLHVAKA